MSAPAISFGPVRSTRLFEEICDQIRGQLLLGKIGPGDNCPRNEIWPIIRCEPLSSSRGASNARGLGTVELRKGPKGGDLVDVEWI
jgi:hypothetical protein